MPSEPIEKMCRLSRQKLGQVPENKPNPLVYCSNCNSEIAPAIGVTNQSQWQDVPVVTAETREKAGIQDEPIGTL
jgi:hypothetical protein